ncbi:MAG: alpha/beta hydrolase [Polyangia bacterium]
MTQPRAGSIQCESPLGAHRMAFTEWGDRDNPRVVVCVHGVSRLGRDFDVLARALSDEFRVVCPDIVGRGQSDWLANVPDAFNHYVVPQYVADCARLMESLGVAQVDWVGTSMGGLIAMGLWSLGNKPFRKLVLNDIGPVVRGLALRRIAGYLGILPRFTSREEGVAYVSTVSAPFGPHSPAQWRALSAPLVVEREPDAKGRAFTLHYDPRIGDAFRVLATGEDMELWPFYDAMDCETLSIRGALSDLFPREVHQQMAVRGPRARLVELEGVGHAPALVQQDQVTLVRRFLLGD